MAKKKKTTKKKTSKKKTTKKKTTKKKTSASSPLTRSDEPTPSKLTRKQIVIFLYYFFRNRGKFPPGTKTQNWADVKMSAMLIDDPPLPGQPHFEKRKLSLELQAWFREMVLELKSPLSLLKQKEKTMRDLVSFCVENQKLG